MTKVQRLTATSEFTWDCLWQAIHALDPRFTRSYAIGMIGGAITPALCESPVSKIPPLLIAPRLDRLGLAARPSRDGLKLGRIRQPLGSRRFRQLDALADWVSSELRSEWLLLQGETAVRGRAGLSVYHSVRESADLLSASGNLTAYRRLARWVSDLIAARTVGAEFLNELAGRQRSRFAKLLRLAASGFGREAGAFVRSNVAMLTEGRLVRPDARRRVGEGIVELLSSLQPIAEEAVRHLLEAVIIRSHVPMAATTALLENPDEPLMGAPLAEAIYLARAGQSPYRRLAARRLRGALSSQAVATLIQLLYDHDLVVAELAADSLSRISPPGLTGIIREATEYRAAGPSDEINFVKMKLKPLDRRHKK